MPSYLFEFELFNFNTDREPDLKLAEAANKACGAEFWECNGHAYVWLQVESSHVGYGLRTARQQLSGLLPNRLMQIRDVQELKEERA
jgi:hypothetical protein